MEVSAQGFVQHSKLSTHDVYNSRAVPSLINNNVVLLPIGVWNSLQDVAVEVKKVLPKCNITFSEVSYYISILLSPLPYLTFFLSLSPLNTLFDVAKINCFGLFDISYQWRCLSIPFILSITVQY